MWTSSRGTRRTLGQRRAGPQRPGGPAARRGRATGPVGGPASRSRDRGGKAMRGGGAALWPGAPKCRPGLWPAGRRRGPAPVDPLATIGDVATADFALSGAYAPTGDQPQAIAEIAEGLGRGERFQTLLGVTGSGKTFTMANVIASTRRPTLVIAHNKTLAAQLCSEFRELLPRQRGRVLRQLLRLLPARGVHPVERHLHREGRLDQRRDRPPAPRGDQRPARRAAT